MDFSGNALFIGSVKQVFNFYLCTKFDNHRESNEFDWATWWSRNYYLHNNLRKILHKGSKYLVTIERYPSRSYKQNAERLTVTVVIQTPPIVCPLEIGSMPIVTTTGKYVYRDLINLKARSKTAPSTPCKPGKILLVSILPKATFISIDSTGKLSVRPSTSFKDVGKFTLSVAYNDYHGDFNTKKTIDVITESASYVANDFDGPLAGAGTKTVLTTVQGMKYCKLQAIKTCSIYNAACRTNIIGASEFIFHNCRT